MGKNLKDVTGSSLEIGDTVVCAESYHGGRPTIKIGKVLRFGEKKITVAIPSRYSANQEDIDTTSRWPDQIFKLPLVEAKEKTFTLDELNHWRNDMLESCIKVVSSSLTLDRAALIKCLEELKHD